MSRAVKRPRAPVGRIRSKNEFELCYLRHQYLRKANTNPTEDEMSPYMPIVEHMARNTYYTYRKLFRLVGLDLEDVTSIGQVHLVSFLGLFSLSKLPKKYEEFVQMQIDKGEECPTDEKILNKDKANCTLFLKQRMNDVVRVCRQKARNVKGLMTDEYLFYVGEKKPPAILSNLLGDHHSFGYKKLDSAVYKSIKKRVKGETGSVFRLNGNYYVAIPIKQRSLTLNDFSGADQDPYDNMHNMNPQQVLETTQESDLFDLKAKEFHSSPVEERAKKIKKFILKNSKNSTYIKEIDLARKMLRKLVNV